VDVRALADSKIAKNEENWTKQICSTLTETKLAAEGQVNSGFGNKSNAYSGL